MRQHLEHLKFKIEHIDYGNLYEAVTEIKEVLVEIVTQLESSLPIDRTDDA
jgi:hypothetical protein